MVTSLLLSAQVWAAERTAPVFPEFSTIESGKTYYLYNVGTEKFLTRSTTNTHCPAVGEYNKAVAVDVIQQTDGSYTLQFSDNKYYIIATSYTISQSYPNNSSYFAIAGNASGYTIQRAPANAISYNETEFVGYATDATDDRIVPTLTEGNIIWKFIEKEAAEYYIAKRRLYEALLQCDTYFYTIDNFEKVYNDPTSSTELLKEAADNVEGGLLLSSKYVSTEWSDYPIFFIDDMENQWRVTSSGDCLEASFQLPGIVTLKAKVNTDTDATLSYRAYSSNGMSLEVYIDDVLVRFIPAGTIDEMSSGYLRYFEEISPGSHEIKWIYTRTQPKNGYYHTGLLQDIGIEKTPYFEVNLIEPGSLGTEVLYNVDHIKDVRRIKINGKMNDDDWAKVSMMTNLYSIDLSDAKVTRIPDKQFYRTSTDCLFLHKIALPDSLLEIGERSFQQSYIETVDFPETLETIGDYAFAYSMLTEAILPDVMKSIGRESFAFCKLLKKVDYPDNFVSTSRGNFQYCNNLKTVLLSEKITIIESLTFTHCSSLNLRLPSKVTAIGNSAFDGTAIDSLFLDNDIVFGKNGSSYSTFHDCNELVYAELPSSFYSVDAQSLISSCDNLMTLVLKSPTVVGGEYKSNFLDGCPTDVVVKVPSFLVNSYKLDEYWYNYKIEGFNTGDIKDWTLNGNLVMNARERFDGKPNLTINKSGSIKLNGDAVQVFDSLYTTSYNYYSGTSDDAFARILVNNDATSIEGEYKHNYYVKGKYWFFVSLPFDFKVSDVTADTEGTKFVFRYYDGASRAANGASGNWKNYTDDAVITAGTGFIVQASADCWLRFTALDNESKQFVVSNEEFVKALAANPSEKASNAGWNLVGNPWQCWYNIHALNFTAPITTYDVYNKKYNAYSIIDDDYAIEPNEAFFVQCPENINSISFPETGRQLTNEIVNQQSAPARKVSAGNRQLVDVLLSCGDANDRTRVVFNDAASMEYETACDASKFFAAEGTCPQLYTIGGEGTEYAINERPYDGGNVQLGVMLAKDGKYTFSLPRCDAKEVVLFDNAIGVSHNFADGDYIFTAEAGTYTDRFVLGVTKASGTTSVAELESAGIAVAAINGGIEVSGAVGKVTILAADGRVVAEFSGERTVPVAPGTYIVRTSAGAVKVVVK